ncbi:alpha/beta hydrolase [Lysinibacter sp. HNR]|uniref:alpha/beta fold hydrolase n=1 Tax=Lysinibacter sp. HNR TaxID=3031408 RepID=UPI00243544D3|nr:alpha/beta hydrolase [Lysinibacter sp. HNR]WGD37425.1 alpha/beta hydrolase [Lysinibacter sp. HNR]
MHYYNTPHGTLAYYDSGERDGANLPLVCLHGFFMNHTIFAPQAEAFSHEHRVISIDAFGHGDSEPGQLGYTFWDQAQYVVELLESLNIKRAIWVGHSQGGFIALRAALLHPETVAGLILIGSEPSALEPEVKEMYVNLFSHWSTSDGPPDAVLDGLATQLLGRPEYWGTWPQSWKSISARDLQPAIDCLLNRDDLSERLPEITAPALVIAGTDDQAITEDRTKALANALLGAEGAHLISGAAHAPHLTHAVPVNDLMSNFSRLLK